MKRSSKNLSGSTMSNNMKSGKFSSGNRSFAILKKDKLQEKMYMQLLDVPELADLLFYSLYTKQINMPLLYRHGV